MPSTVEARLNKLEGLVRVLLGRTGGSGAGLVDGDYGDVTVGGSGTTMTIDSGVVTYAKMQDVSATDKILGRSTAGSGDVEEIACTSAGRAILDDATAAAQCTTLGLGTGDSPQFTAVNIGAATDTTIARVSAGVISVEGDTVVTLGDGGTFTAAVEAADHGTAATDQVVNVCYGTGSAPTASTTTEGALWIKYTA